MSRGFRLIWGFCVGAQQSGVAPPPASVIYLLLRYLLILPTHNFLRSVSPFVSSLFLAFVFSLRDVPARRRQGHMVLVLVGERTDPASRLPPSHVRARALGRSCLQVRYMT